MGSNQDFLKQYQGLYWLVGRKRKREGLRETEEEREGRLIKRMEREKKREEEGGRGGLTLKATASVGVGQHPWGEGGEPS